MARLARPGSPFGAFAVFVASALGPPMVLAASQSPPKPRAAQATDGVPVGTIAFFFLTVCPPSWTPPQDGTGRLVVAVSDPSLGGMIVGNPLGDQENRIHSHAFTASVTYDSKEITGAESCCNDSATKAGTYTTSGRTADAATGLPFLQLVLCEKQ